MKTRIRSAGFTLIEVLVAMAIFGILAALSSIALGQALSNSDMLNERMDRLQSIQRTMTFLSNELLQTAPRPVRADFGLPAEPALQSTLGSDFALQVTHGGWPNSAGVPRSTLQRTAYRIEDRELVRYHWNVLDRTVNNLPVATVLMEDIDSLSFRFLQANGEWSDQWPPINVQTSSDTSMRPRAVAIVLELPIEGELTRIVEVAP